MMSPIKNFDPNTDPIELQSPGSLRTIARRIKTRALRAGHRVLRAWCSLPFWLAMLVVWLPLWLLIDVVLLACDSDGGRRERVTMPRKDATTHASDVDGGGQ